MSASDPRAAVLLDEIHGALRRRAFGELAALGAALEAEIDHPSQPIDPAALAMIRRKADRNAATLLAVQRGIRAALRRLAEIRAVSNGLVTYDRSGRRAAQGQSDGRGLAARF